MNIFDSLFVEKYRPAKLDDIVLTPENRQYFEQIRIKGEIPNLMFAGPPGSGKSTLAKVLVKDVLDCQYIYINASDETGIDTIRSKVCNFAQTKSIDGKLKVIILDEMDGLSTVTGSSGRSSAQQALRNVMEEYAGNTRFILTCNYPYKVIPALHSRCQSFDLTPPFEGCVKRCIEILNLEHIKVDEDNKKKLLELIKNNYPDLRKAINGIQKFIINGELKIGNTGINTDFAKLVFDKIKPQTMDSLRQYVIQNEIQFNNDYHDLLKGLFEVVYSSNLQFDKKRAAMLMVSSAMYQHQTVLDAEINCFACLLQLSEILG